MHEIKGHVARGEAALVEEAFDLAEERTGGRLALHEPPMVEAEIRLREFDRPLLLLW